MMVQTRGLRKLYGGHTALSDVDINVAEGSVYGLVGPNGAGKTTLLAVLSGLRRPSAGEISLGTDRHRMAVLPDTPQFDAWLTGREVVSLAARLADTADAEAQVLRNLADAGLAEAADRRVGGYSRGMLQRLGIACTLVGVPSLLLLDEPASALDPSGRREVLDLIARLRGHATVIMSSHILADVQEVCDSVGILRHGRLLFEGNLDSLLVGRAVPAYRLHLRSPAQPVTEALRTQDWVLSVQELTPHRLYLSVRSLSEAEKNLPAVLAGAGAQVISMSPDAPDLEDVFLELTS